MKLLITLLLLSSVSCWAKNSELIKVDKLYLEYAKTMSERDYRLPEEITSTQALNVGLEFDLGKGFFWKNRIVSLIDESQFRMIGWEFDLGAEVYKGIELFYRHSSHHILDMESDMGQKYPVYNGIGARINLIY